MLTKRASGVLMHISSLPDDSAIGTFSQEAYDFVDRLKKAGQTYWQILPLGPTGFGDSPYQSFSTFAGNPYFIDLKELCRLGYLGKEDYDNADFTSNATRVDYGKIYTSRYRLFKKIQPNFEKNIPDDYFDFCKNEAYWLDDYSLFMAIKDSFGAVSFHKWDKEHKHRESPAVKEFEKSHKKETEFYKMLQYFFFTQWEHLKNYANKNGIKIIGDLPIYVSDDSCDVWSNPKVFCLDENLDSRIVAGCPPDAFTDEGQLWGNPLYDWNYLKGTGYKWWIDRIKGALRLYDVVRIDHFRGFESYYSVKAEAKNAKNGEWLKGPNMDLWSTVKKQLGDIPVIAEDLGFLTDGVRRLLDESGFPGMKVLQFAFDSREESDYLPHNYTRNSVVYTGTHDNDTINGWLKAADKRDIEFAKKYLRVKEDDDFARVMMQSALASVSDICILTMQDLLGLSTEARMNIPSSLSNNWRWRATKKQLDEADWNFLYENTRLYGRLNGRVVE